MLNVFDIFVLALGNWLQCCSLKSWAGIFIRELETLRNNLWSTEKQSHYNQEVLILRKVQQEKWIAIQFPEEFPHNQDPFTKRVKGRWNQSAITGRMAVCWDKDSQEDASCSRYRPNRAAVSAKASLLFLEAITGVCTFSTSSVHLTVVKWWL